MRPVGAAAIQVAAKRLLQVSLTDAEANGLTVFGSVPRAIRELQERLRVQRQVPGVSLDEKSQVAVAVAEVVSAKSGTDAASGTEAVGIRQVIKTVADIYGAAERLQREHATIEELETVLENRGRRFRRFVRALARERSKLLNRVRSRIHDDRRTEAAIGELDVHFAEHLRRAVMIDGPEPR